MAKPPLLRTPSLESGSSLSTPGVRPSLFDAKDSFIERVAPIGMAAIYFGSFTLKMEDAALSRQALYKLAFVYRHFLQPGGLRVAVQRQTAVISGSVTSRSLAILGDILAQQIEGIRRVKDETKVAKSDAETAKTGWKRTSEAATEALQFLFATDQTLRSGVQLKAGDHGFTLEGRVSTTAQKNWAEQLVQAVAGEVDSKLQVAPAPATPAVHPPDVDDESLQALILFRLRLVRETEHLPVRLKATRGVVTLQGKVRTEALRQRVENIARSTLGLKELRSSLSIAN